MKSKSEHSANCLVVVGEKSGEEHFLSFFPKLRDECSEISWWGVGGNLMSAEGVELLYHLKDFSTWGFSEALKKIPFYMKALKNIYRQVALRKTRAAILVDFQGFNLRLARKLSSQGVAVFYYVAPQSWVWKPSRTKVLKKSVHTLFTILPFEKEWFFERGVERVVSVPHPLWIQYKNKWIDEKRKSVTPILLLLPGSRNFEVELILPEFIKVSEALKRQLDIKVVLVEANNVDKNIYSLYRNKVDIVYKDEQIEEALKSADYALAASGTVTLATALFAIPTIVVYKGSLLNEFIFYNLIRYKNFICLPNIICGEEIFPEFLQNRATSFNIRKKLLNLLNDESEYRRVQEKLVTIRRLLKGDCNDCGSYMRQGIKEVYEKRAD